jgi:hypothetical protein
MLVELLIVISILLSACSLLFSVLTYRLLWTITYNKEALVPKEDGYNEIV